MDGESILVYAGIAQIVGVAIVTLLVWTMKVGRSEGVRASDIAALRSDLAATRKDFHDLHDMINVRPTHEMVKLKIELVETRLRLEIKTTEAALATTVAAAAAAAAAARHEP